MAASHRRGPGRVRPALIRAHRGRRFEIDIERILQIIGGVIVLGGALGFWWWQEKKTADKKTREAEKNGWTYQRVGKGLPRKYRHLPFVDGDSLKVKHVMRGEFRGRPITLFTFKFQEEEYVRRGLLGDGDRNNDGKRDTRKVKRQYGVAVVGAPMDLPRFELSATARAGRRRAEERGRGMSKIAGNLLGDVLGGSGGALLFGKDYTGQKVTTDDPTFDETFTVRSTEPERMRALLTPQARSWLMESKNAHKYVVWCDGEEIITWGNGTDTAIGKVKAGYLNDLLDQLPVGQPWGPPPA